VEETMRVGQDYDVVSDQVQIAETLHTLTMNYYVPAGMDLPVKAHRLAVATQSGCDPWTPHCPSPLCLGRDSRRVQDLAAPSIVAHMHSPLPIRQRAADEPPDWANAVACYS